jgi:hypothetical protein
MIVENKRDASLNLSTKPWLVPAGEMWRVLSACVSLATTATVGNRLMCIQVLNEAGAQIKRLVPGNVQAASTTVFYCFLQGIYRETSVVNGAIEGPIPIDFYVLPGNTIRFCDINAVDPVADDMIVAFQIERIAL